MNLFQDLIDVECRIVDAVVFLPPAPLPLITLGDRVLGLTVLLARLFGGLNFRNFIGRFLLKLNN